MGEGMKRQTIQQIPEELIEEILCNLRVKSLVRFKSVSKLWRSLIYSAKFKSMAAMSLELVIDTKGKRVLFAEAGKDFLDFLVWISSLPVGTVIGLMKKQITKPDQGCCSETSGSSVPLLALTDDVSSARKFYKCGNCYSYFSDDPTANCPKCQCKMTFKMTYVRATSVVFDDLFHRFDTMPEQGGGFVKGAVTYMVTDDLVVTPMSSINIIALIQKYNVNSFSDLEDKVVKFGFYEAVKLLNASLRTKNVLTHVFLSCKMGPDVEIVE